MRIAVGAATDVGRVREGNEDAYIVDERLGLWAVADGMGGHQGGEVASATALETLRASIEAGRGLGDAISAANAAVFARAARERGLSGMGTTLTGVILTGRRLILGHVGDSRAYLWRDGTLTRLTDDHSLVEEMVREGRITSEQAAVHPQRSIVTRVVGVERSVDADVVPVDLQPGDRLLLCSDGLTSMVGAETIADALRSNADPDAAADRLVAAANAGGGEDNVTVLVLDVVDDGTPVAPSAIRAVAATTDGAASAGAPATPDGAVVVASTSDADSPADTPVRVAAAPLTADALSPAPAPVAARRRRRGAKLLAWGLPIVLLLGLAGGAVYWRARQSWYVGASNGVVTVYRGVPGGLLGISPTVDRRTALSTSDLTEAQRLAVESGHEVSSRAAAIAYADRLAQDATARRASTTTTTSPTTTTTTPSTTTTVVTPAAPPPAAP